MVTLPMTSAFLWRYEPVRRTGKSDDWLTIFFARIIRFTVQKFQLFWVIFCIIIFFIELWHNLILWLAKMPNGSMPVFTLIATGWRYRKIFFYKKSTADDLECPLTAPNYPIFCILHRHSCVVTGEPRDFKFGTYHSKSHPADEKYSLKGAWSGSGEPF